MMRALYSIPVEPHRMYRRRAEIMRSTPTCGELSFPPLSLHYSLQFSVETLVHLWSSDRAAVGLSEKLLSRYANPYKIYEG